MAKTSPDDFTPVENAISRRMVISVTFVFIAAFAYAYAMSIFSANDNFIFECFNRPEKMSSLYYHIYTEKSESECCGVGISCRNPSVSEGTLTSDITVRDVCGELHNIYYDDFIIKVHHDGKYDIVDAEHFDRIVLPVGSEYSFTLSADISGFSADENCTYEIMFFHGDPRTGASFMLNIV